MQHKNPEHIFEILNTTNITVEKIVNVRVLK